MKEKVLVARERFVIETVKQFPCCRGNFAYKAFKRKEGGQNEGKTMKGYIKKKKKKQVKHWYVLAPSNTGRNQRAGCVNF